MTGALHHDERVLAGGPGDFLEARHLLLRGPQRAIGRHLATLARDRHGVRKLPWTDPRATASSTARPARPRS